MAYKIFLVEDNGELGQLLKTYLSKEGFNVTYFMNGLTAEHEIDKKPDIWVLDIMLPDLDGFELMRRIKQKFPSLPVVFISARDKELDRVLGLELGSDDYIAKPFLPRELVIRVKRLLERCYEAPIHEKRTYSVGNYRISREDRNITENGTEIILTSKETDLLFALISNVGIPLSRNRLLTAIGGDNFLGSDGVLDAFVRR
jgi:two-component system, OmpR family, response regulator CssR